MAETSDTITVLHVDDDPAFAETAAEFLERESERLVVNPETTARDGLARLREEEVDCIVSDYRMPGMDGLEFLERVREDYPDLPFILFTGKGSEGIASEAISAGVTDYLGKDPDTHQYAILANRIENAVDRSRSERELERYRAVVESLRDPVMVFDEEYRLRFVNRYVVETLGVGREDLVGEPVTDVMADFFEPVDTDGEARLMERLDAIFEGERDTAQVEFTFRRDGSERVGDLKLVPVDIDGDVEGVVGIARDITARKRYEHDLEETTRTVEAIIDAAPDAIVVVDDDGRVERWNPAAERIFGWSREEVLGEPIPLVSGEPDDEFEAQLGRALAGETVSGVEVRRQTKAGESIDVSVSNAPVRDVAGDITGAVSVITDITHRRRREEELRRVKERFEAIFEASNDAMLIVDPEAEVIHEANPQAAELLGYSREELLSTVNPVTDLHPSDRDRFEAFADRVLREGQEETDALTCRHKDGRLIPVEVSAAAFDFDDACCMLVNVRDITDRKRREEALDSLHETTRAFMEAQDRETIAATATETAKTILDLPRNGIWLYDEGADALRPAAVTEEAARVVDDQPVFSGEGSLAWEAFETGDFLVFDDVREASERYNADTPIRSELIIPLGEYGVMMVGSTEVGAFDDIDVSLARVLAANTETAMERAERETRLRIKQRELQRQNERLEEFASVVSHDLRNPLNVAAGNLELAMETGERERLDSVRSALDRMDEMIDDLLTLTREGKSVEETEPIALESIVEGCWHNIDTGEAELVIETTATLEADKSRVRHVFENLFRNAVEHVGPGVTVRVGRLRDEGGFYIEDDGPGIPEDEREEVFEAGYTTADDGTGFGLNIVEEIVEAHGWEISVTEGVDGGARFEVTGVASMEG